MSRVRLWPIGWLVALASLGVLVGIEQVRLDQLKPRVEAELSRAVNRRVTLRGPLRLMLLWGPGFVAEDVLIHDDPRISREPLAYVSELRVALRWWDLLRGRLSVGSLRLVEPSVNLVQSPGGEWNYVSLLARAAAARSGHRFPEVHVRQGRVNFRQGLRKSAFYFGAADLDLTVEPGEPGTVRIEFVGEPARTDRPVRRFGQVEVDGEFTLGPQPRLNLTARLRRGALSEILGFLWNRRVELEGFVSIVARIHGSPSALTLDGNVRFEQLEERLVTLPLWRKRWEFPLRGQIALPKQSLQLVLNAGQAGEPRLLCQLAVHEFLRRARWASLFRLERVPLDGLRQAAQRLGWQVPIEAAMEGLVTGLATWHPDLGIRGAFTITGLRLEPKGVPPLEVPQAVVRLGEGSIVLEPARGTLETGSGRLSGELAMDGSSLKLEFLSEDWPLVSWSALWRSCSGLVAPHAFGWFQRGRWKGKLNLNWHKAEPPGWSGRLEVREAVPAGEGVLRHVRIVQGQLWLDPSGSSELTILEGKVFEHSFRARYRDWGNLSEASRQLDLELESADGRFLAQLASTWSHKDRRRLLPPWLFSRRSSSQESVEGMPLIGTMVVHHAKLFGTRGLEWKADELRCRLEAGPGGFQLLSCLAPGSRGGVVGGDLKVAPSGELLASGRLWARGMAWHGGRLGLMSRVEILQQDRREIPVIQLEGSFWAQSLGAESSEIRRVEGRFTADSREPDQVRLMGVELTDSGGSYYGSGRLGADGSVRLELFDPFGRYLLTGTLQPLAYELEAAR